MMEQMTHSNPSLSLDARKRALRERTDELLGLWVDGEHESLFENELGAIMEPADHTAIISLLCAALAESDRMNSDGEHHTYELERFLEAAIDRIAF
jgi:hypothetical protein